jgi:hypothetical protein
MTTYTVITLAGNLTATWDDDSEDSQVVYTGSDAAKLALRMHIETGHIVNGTGELLNIDNLDPNDLYGFCQSDEKGILILPNRDDLEDMLGRTADGD